MPEPNQNPPATVPEQPEAKPPLRKSMPVVIALVVIIGLIGIANISSLLSGNKKSRARRAHCRCVRQRRTRSRYRASRRSSSCRRSETPTTRQQQQELAAAMQQLQAGAGCPGPGGRGRAADDRRAADAIYGDSPNAPTHTSECLQAQAEAKQKAACARRSSSRTRSTATPSRSTSRIRRRGGHRSPGSSHCRPGRAEVSPSARPPQRRTALASSGPRPDSSTAAEADSARADPMAPYDFDTYDGRLYRVFEGTVLEGVVTNHIDGGFSGPIMVSLTTDLYSHDHQQLLLPQGTRLLGDVQSVGNAQQRKMFVTFHRAICPDGFSLEFAKYIGLDQIGTTGLATKVNHGYLQAFAAAAAIGGLGGLAQIGNNGSVLYAFDRDSQRHLRAVRRRRRTGIEPLSQPLADHHAQGRFPRPRVHRHRPA